MTDNILHMTTGSKDPHKVLVEYLDAVSMRLESLLPQCVPEVRGTGKEADFVEVDEELKHRYAFLQIELTTFRLVVLGHALEAGALQWSPPPRGV